MAKQTINIGTTANDGTGDPIRAAFGKVNDNFTEIYTANTGVNTGDQNLSAYATTAAVAAGYQPLDSDLTAISALTTTAYGRALLSTADAATLRSAIGVGQTDAPTFLAQTLTGQSLTGTQATSLVDLATTWNTTGNPSLIYGRVTNTNSGTTANLIDLGTFAGGSLFSVTKAGQLLIKAGSPSTEGGVQFGNEFVLRSVVTNDSVGLLSGGTVRASMGTSGFRACSGAEIGFSDNVGNITTIDTPLRRDAAGILAQRNGVNAQAFRVANSVGASPLVDYDRGTFGFPAGTNTLRIGTENGGTYTTARPIDFVTGGVVRMSIAAAGEVNFNHALLFAGIGRFRFLSNGVALISNAAEADFGRLCLGANTDAFPAIARDGAGIKFTGAAAGSTSWIKVPAVAVSALPSAATAGAGARAFVSDALSPVFGSAVTGTGFVYVPVYSTGSAWHVG